MNVPFLDMRFMHESIKSEMMSALDQWNTERSEIAEYYLNNIKNNKVTLPYKSENVMHVWHQFIVRSEDRDELQKYLTSNAIGTMIHYPVPIHKQDAYPELHELTNKLPIAESMASEVLSLPIYPGLPKEHLSYIVEVISKF